MEALKAVYQQARKQRAVLVAIERQAGRWAVKADTITAPQHTVTHVAHDSVRAAVVRLIRSREIRSDSSAGPVYFVLHDVEDEQRARALAAALHAALYGDLELLARAVPPNAEPDLS
ncbi:hypothetical protein [Streptomyces chartreusis]|uniref:hypothetical protein n=1 Tax=Streptomyces chartreusis TaxID=1969 RepID=UPI0038283AAE